MAGHSKWNNIKHRKGASDAKRAQIFTKIGREMALAIKNGGANPESNSVLRDVIAKAKSFNVPTDNINRMLSKYAGGVSENYESIVYEGYGPKGVAVIVETLTDNRNRTAPEMRHYFDKYGGNLGTSGSVAWQFDYRGVLALPSENRGEDDAMMAAIEAGAADFVVYDDIYEIQTEPNELNAVRETLEKQGFAFEQAERAYIPREFIELSDPEDIKNMQKLLDMLDDNDDVQNVYHNWKEE